MKTITIDSQVQRDESNLIISELDSNLVTMNTEKGIIHTLNTNDANPK